MGIKFEKKSYRIVVMAILLAVSCFMTYYFHRVLGLGTVFTHFFYIPIILASLWWKRRGLLVAAFLAAVLIFGHLVFREVVLTINDYIRVAMFIVIAFFVAWLSEQIAMREGKLRVNEERFSSFMDSAIDGFFLLDSELDYVEINKVGLQIFPAGTKKEDIIGKNIVKIVHDIKESGRYDRYREVIKTGKPFFVDDIVPHPKFGDRHLAVKAFKVGKGLGIVVTDITELKKTEEALKKSEEKYRELIESTKDGVMISDSDGKVSFINLSYVEMLGYKSPEELIGKPVAELYAKPEQRKKIFKEMMGKGSFKNLEIELIKKDGNSLYILASGTIHKDKKGNVIKGEGIVRDITEQKKAEEMLRESEEKYHSLYSKMAEGVYLHEIIYDESGQAVDYRIIDANPASEIHLDIKRENAINKLATELYGTDKAPFLEIYAKVAETGEPVSFKEYSPLMEKHFQISAYSPGKGKFATVFTDITKREWAEEKLKEYSEHLEEMVEQRTKELRDAQEELVRKEKLATLGQLAGGVGHELRNPLGVISNSVYYLKMKLKDADEKALRHLDILRMEVERANKIVTNLLDFSRTRLPSREEGDANDIVKNVLASIEIPGNISVETQLDETLPRILLDPDQIQQAFQNIISNSVQAMGGGGKLRIKTGIRGKFAEIMFEDTGEGIAKENLSRIFEPLFTTRTKGIGLGLAIVKSLVDGHEGQIEVKSEVGEGTTITVKLPFHGKKGRIK